MDSRASRIERELRFQEALSLKYADISRTPVSITARYRKNRHWRIFPKEYIYRSMGDLHGKRVLDFGCGPGEITTQLAALGADVVAFDLSPEQAAIAERRSELDGVADRVEVFTANGEEVALPLAAFDYVVAFALLHHTDVAAVVCQIYDALKPDGVAFIAEPVSFSRSLSWLRDHSGVPKIVSPDERQLTAEDLQKICAPFKTSEVRYFNALGRLQRFLLGEPIRHGGRVRWLLTVALHYVDRLLLSVPGAWRLAGTVVIRATK